VLVIEGPAGIGKSRLLTEVMALADQSGVRTLFGEAFEYQQTVPFFALFMATLRADPPVGGANALAGWAARRICATGWCAIWPTSIRGSSSQGDVGQRPTVVDIDQTFHRGS
jgi:predicted ATPase